MALPLLQAPLHGLRFFEAHKAKALRSARARVHPHIALVYRAEPLEVLPQLRCARPLRQATDEDGVAAALTPATAITASRGPFPAAPTSAVPGPAAREGTLVGPVR